MKLPAARGTVAEKRLKKLYGRRENDRRVPVFGGEVAPVPLARRFVFVCLVFDVCVVRDDAARAQDGLKHRLCLLDDAAIGNDIDDAAQAGWLFAQGGFIGDASSNASVRANADTAALFAFLWSRNASDDKSGFDTEIRRQLEAFHASNGVGNA